MGRRKRRQDNKYLRQFARTIANKRRRWDKVDRSKHHRPAARQSSNSPVRELL